MKRRTKNSKNEYIGKKISGWTITDYINSGKSASVFKATKGTKFSALKIFSNGIIDKYGAEIQLARIEREKLLIRKTHPNLVEIIGGGYCRKLDVYFVIMEYLPWKNLSELLSNIPVGLERSIISQVASAARFLEELSICHRDIKPANIAISADFKQVKLLDLGVIRPHGVKTITDGTGGKHFIGTLKYSPPEFLLREEKHSLEGWRALTFYQLGGVLHDLIMRRALFSEYEEPFARLVNAVQHDIPTIESKSVSQSLVELTRYCLLKPAETRLQLVSWDLFSKEPLTEDLIGDIKSRIIKRGMSNPIQIQNAKQKKNDLSHKLEGYYSDLQNICRLECIGNRSIFPPVEIQIVKEQSNIHFIIVQFAPSKTNNLSIHLRLEFTICWLDAINDILEVSVSALSSTSKLHAKQKLATENSVLHKGIYAPDSVRVAVITALYRAIDQAQESTSIDTNIKAPIPQEALRQLNLGKYYE